MVFTCEAEALFFLKVFVSKSVMSINGLSFASARPAPQRCVPVLVCAGNSRKVPHTTIQYVFFCSNISSFCFPTVRS